MSGINAGYTTFRGSVKSTGYPLHSPVSPSLLLPCVTVCHHISTGLYLRLCDARGEVLHQPSSCNGFVWYSIVTLAYFTIEFRMVGEYGGLVEW